MTLRPLLLPACLLVLAAAGPAPAQPPFFFKDGDTVVMLGDSITEQRLYSNYVELWTVTRFPAWNLTFRNVGIGGDTSGGGNARFRRDVLAHKATALTVDFGMNDGRYTQFKDETFTPYLKGLQGIADQAKAAGVRVAWLTPQPTAWDKPGDRWTAYNETLEKFSAGVKQVADKNGGLFVDQFHPYQAVLKKAGDAAPTTKVTGGDPVHPGPAGQALMAASILKGLGFPREVSSVRVVVDKPGETQTTNCKVTDLAFAGGVRFLRHDRALPFFPAAAKDILKHAPLLEELNDYRLQVRGLPAGKYTIHLAQMKVAEHTADELAEGVNLAAAALAAGPIAHQLKQVVAAVDAKTNYYHDQIFRGLILADTKAKVFQDVPAGEREARRQALIAERMKAMPEHDAAIRAALAPRPHLVEIFPVRAR